MSRKLRCGRSGHPDADVEGRVPGPEAEPGVGEVEPGAHEGEPRLEHTLLGGEEEGVPVDPWTRARETGQRRALDRVGDQIEDARFYSGSCGSASIPRESRRVREATAAAR